MAAIGAYVIRPYPGRLTLFRAKQGASGVHADAFGGWGDTARGGVEVHEIPGGHMNVLEEPQVQVFADQLRVCLERARSARSVEPASSLPVPEPA